MIQLSNKDKLNIIFSQNIKSTKEKQAKIYLKQLNAHSPTKELKEVLDTLLQKSSNNQNIKQTLLNLLKNNPTFKELSKVKITIQELLKSLKTTKNELPIERFLKDFLVDIKDIDTKKLQISLKNSGIFLESKLKDLKTGQDIKEILSNDMKSLLLKTTKQLADVPLQNKEQILKHIDKLLLQIDYYQVISHLSNSAVTYIPFSWEAVDKGEINIKKDRHKRFYCDIDLTLKEYGEVNLKLILYEQKQLTIHINSDNQDFKNMLQENINLLRKKLIENNIIIKEIRFFKKNNIKNYSQDNSEDINMGFEIKV